MAIVCISIAVNVFDFNIFHNEKIGVCLITQTD